MGATPQDDLREELTARQVVVIVGAGVSVAATGGAPTASWTGLLEDGVAYCQSLRGPSLPAGWADRRRAQLASGDTDELISAAEDITRRLGAPGGGEYLRRLEQSVGQLTAGSWSPSATSRRPSSRPHSWERRTPATLFHSSNQASDEPNPGRVHQGCYARRRHLGGQGRGVAWPISRARSCSMRAPARSPSCTPKGPMLTGAFRCTSH